MPKWRYTYTCPACGEEFVEDKKHLLKFACLRLGEHVLKNHPDLITEWFNSNPRNWRYVRRELIRLLGKPIAVTLTGKPIIPELTELVAELRKIKDPKTTLERLLDTLKELETRKHESMQSHLNWLALKELVDWVCIYWAERACKYKVEAETG